MLCGLRWIGVWSRLCPELLRVMFGSVWCGQLSCAVLCSELSGVVWNLTIRSCAAGVGSELFHKWFELFGVVWKCSEW